MERRDIQHLYARAGFGASKPLLDASVSMKKKAIVDHLFETSEAIIPLEIDLSAFTNLSNQDLKNKALIRELRKKSRGELQTFNHRWMERLHTSEGVFREKMTLFWANHFVCQDNNIVYAQAYNNTLRTHALGNFREFVKAISKEAAMLRYLNTKQNRKAKPNENFARELMELFTLGVGQYSEKDIKESARAFTGYNHDLKGDFKFREFQHDAGEKVFFGKTGNFNGDDIINIILEQKECAHFICGRIYRYFVNDNVNNKHVEALTEVFYKDYNIENLMRHLFMADWFYEENNIGSKIKSPVEFLVGLQQLVPFTFDKTKDLIKIQKLLGQVLLYPPNVAGWKGGKNWIDSNTLMLRLKSPSIILANTHISIQEKGEFEDSFDKFYSESKKKQFIKATIAWEVFDKTFDGVSYDELQSYIILPKISGGTQSYLTSLNQNSQRNFCVQLMSLPEYQMC
ncbi:DUF1800 domain-containing protein [Subsaximicrobium wynnwilliamsii]|uniref:DUF1800 domain-containing protein n=1 Tax=Subsaximicrobium wynnwilliamsii TaxID=291179 RepID=A0A5C6ZC45_9FLAO|nr:DUF1800 domain-containing protein [Subsaximicrobium wynnwilliamsii]TXD81463.1 DUF1800 domain-containing protein [Subsaximicrobium wynnwilliamsii]TXD87059.1 DUF1800 domain-containing protein [Subsaximicrobium wynnwilliamsii]TXE00818.1 DUF1800 domain-containing protein [Subsaximicrobium wynnwilliamsii]